MKAPEPLPDCPNCDAANTLRTVQHVMRRHIAECSCCAKQCRIEDGRAVPIRGTDNEDAEY